ncbi:uncharacterized protein TRIADDRAFT_57123 [Trichoplax adhaerens]|uniref:SAM domain-containing protein n=1 Tax=Trichoplax adhaerens TaxID=10228 RepID=B3S0P3_TRIAD|nr:hypothetical protein TRIADDRAFT_57123 [Trichoplax adhaerens]EDV23678.1 hypothetical protein TRIADDRAFT_57123 [Trichoplax adhaerens]|eukprot:XP_002113204.1 hypothetical protein TRIADDRAFT_57123 [Trichoplax adhaerens]
MTTTASEWMEFFIAAGIPSSPASNYAILFSENRIHRKMLPELTKDILKEMGITPIGDMLAILKHAKEVHDNEIMRGLVSDNPRSIDGPSAKMRIGPTNINEVKKSQEDTVTTSSQKSRAMIAPTVAPTLKMVQSATEQSVKDVRKATAPTATKPSSHSGKQSVFDRLGASQSEQIAKVASHPVRETHSVFKRLGGIQHDNSTSAKDRLQPSVKINRKGLSTVDIRQVKLGSMKRPTEAKKPRASMTKAEKVALARSDQLGNQESALSRLGGSNPAATTARRLIIRKR